MATYDNELTLIKIDVAEDELGNQKPVERERRTILCSKKSVGRTEFYDAAVTGLKPSVIFTIHAYEYEDETKLGFHGIEYNVIKTYQVNFEELELTCERDLGQ